MTHVWGYGGDGDVGLIKAHIRHLRQKIETDPAKPRYILTVPGVGYTMVRHSVHEQEVRNGEILHLSPPLRAVAL